MAHALRPKAQIRPSLSFLNQRHARLRVRAQGLLALQFADEEELLEPQRVYCMPGLSFSPRELFEEIKHFKPTFEVTYGPPDPDVRRAGLEAVAIRSTRITLISPPCPLMPPPPPPMGSDGQVCKALAGHALGRRAVP